MVKLLEESLMANLLEGSLRVEVSLLFKKFKELFTIRHLKDCFNCPYIGYLLGILLVMSFKELLESRDFKKLMVFFI